jgi:hypothetical protein
MDIDSIPFGADYRVRIQEALSRTDVVAIVIGPKWFGEPRGDKPRIFQTNDPVRLEVAAALKKPELLVTPLLVDGAEMPAEADLPDDIKDLHYRNAAPIDSGRDFNAHVDRFIRSVEEAEHERERHAGEERRKKAAEDAERLRLEREAHEAQRRAEREAARRKKLADEQPQEDPKPIPPPVPWYRTRLGAIGGAIFVAGVIAVVVHAQPGPAPVADTTPSPVESVVLATPTQSAALATPDLSVFRRHTFAPLSSISTSRAFAQFFTSTSDFACPMSGATISEEFLSHQSAWDPLPPSTTISGGFFEITPPRGKFEYDLRSGPLRDGLICADLFNGTSGLNRPTHADSAAGLLFWSEKPDIFSGGDLLYAFFISPTGWYDVWRHAGGKWTALVTYTRSSAVKTGVSQSNILTVRTAGNRATFYINGTEVNSITNAQPKGSLGGLVVETSVNEHYNVTYEFGDFGARY